MKRLIVFALLGASICTAQTQIDPGRVGWTMNPNTTPQVRSIAVGNSTSDLMGPFIWIGALTNDGDDAAILGVRAATNPLSANEPSGSHFIRDEGSYDPAVYTITGCSITSNVATCHATNSFAVGNSFSLAGLTTFSYMNWITTYPYTFVHTITAATSSTFSFAYTHADVSYTADSGYAQGQGGYAVYDGIPTIGAATDQVPWNHMNFLQDRPIFQSSQIIPSHNSLSISPTNNGTGHTSLFGVVVQSPGGIGIWDSYGGLYCNYSATDSRLSAGNPSCIYDTSGSNNYMSGSLQLNNNVHINLGNTGAVTSSGPGTFANVTNVASSLTSYNAAGGVSIWGGGANQGAIDAYTAGGTGGAQELDLNTNGGGVGLFCAACSSNGLFVVSAATKFYVDSSGNIVNTGLLNTNNQAFAYSGSALYHTLNTLASTMNATITGYGGYHYYNPSTGTYAFYLSTTSVSAGSALGNVISPFSTYPTGTNTAIFKLGTGTSFLMGGGPTMTATQGLGTLLLSSNALSTTAGTEMCVDANGTPSTSGCATGLSGMTAGQVPIAGTATTVTSSKALAGSGTGVTTGPNSSVDGHCVSFSGTSGQIQDSGAACGTGSGTVTDGSGVTTGGYIPVSTTSAHVLSWTPTSTYTLSAPALSANDTVVTLGTTQTLAGAKSFTTSILATTAGTPSIGSTTKWFNSLYLGLGTSYYTLLQGAASQSGNVTLTSPLLTGSDTLVTAAATQTLTNKSISGGQINSGTISATYGGTGLNWGASSGMAVWASGTASLYNTTCSTALTYTAGGTLGCNTLSTYALLASPTFTGTVGAAAISATGIIATTSYHNSGTSGYYVNGTQALYASGGNIVVGGGTYTIMNSTMLLTGASNVVYRCTTAGALPIGALTISSASCGASSALSMEVN